MLEQATSTMAVPDRPGPARVVRVGFANLCATNRQRTAATQALLDLDLDVLGLSEITPAWLRELESLDVAAKYPHRITRIGSGWNDVVLLSRTTIVEQPCVARLSAIAGLIDVAGSPVTVVAVQVPSPFEPGLFRWMRSHRLFRELVDRLPHPILAVGDFNALRRQRPMRSLERRGFVEVHNALRSSSHGSWPARLPIMRIDHGLVTTPLTPLRVSDVSIPGSDHPGFVLEVTLPTKAPASAEKRQ